MRIVDTETWSLWDVKSVGLSRHFSRDAGTLVTAVGWRDFPDGETRVWLPLFEDMPAEWKAFDGPLLAHYAAYDRNALLVLANRQYLGFPFIPPAHWHDSAVLARACGLPSKLDACMRALGRPGKLSSRSVSSMFGPKPLPPQSDPRWAELVTYLRRDVDAVAWMLEDALHPLLWHEWEQYQAAEYINQRGLPVDAHSVERVLALMADVAPLFARDFADGTGLKPTQTKKINEWVYETLPAALRPLMLTDEGKLTLDKRTALPALLAHPELPVEARKALSTLAECRKSSVAKYEAIAATQHNGFVRHSYIFGGAGATGRFTSRGVQMHNLPKKTPDPAFLEDLEYLPNAELLQKYNWHQVPNMVKDSIRAMIRPARHIGEEEQVVVWVDWSAIEARVLPWLTLDPRVENRLDIFRQNGDIYMDTVERVYGSPDLSLRPAGKAMELALGYCGGIGALTTFCDNLGVQMTEDEKASALAAWREANEWALAFGDRLMDAFATCFHEGIATKAGRIAFSPGSRGVSVWMILPDGRRLPYRAVRPVWNGLVFTRFDDAGRAYDVRLWPGLLSENATQATAASLLRNAITRIIKTNYAYLVGHTHDELIGVAALHNARRAALYIADVMTDNPAWAPDLPLNVEWSYGPRYGLATAKGTV